MIRGPVSQNVDREAFEKSQTTSIQKAISQQEVQAKEKHVRNAIMGTYQEKGAKIFWHVVRRLPLSTHAVTCWKFCHVLHKLLRDGHERTLDCSIKYKQQVRDLGGIWIHAVQVYGSIISRYCKCLVLRMEFQAKYKEFPGNLVVSDEVLESIGSNDVSSYFTLCIDIMDLMDTLVELQEGIFKTLDFSRAVSMTGVGQCRLAPCIPIILDSSQLYDYTVKLMFKLHGTLPPDTLTGHRDRFAILFKKLKSFYYQSSNMHYFKTLIQIPILPDTPPDFMKTEATHQLAAAKMLDVSVEFDREPSPEPAPEPVESLIDTNFDAVFGGSDMMGNFSFQPDNRDDIIRELKERIRILESQIEQMSVEHRNEIKQLLDRIHELERELAGKDDLIRLSRNEVGELQQQLLQANQKIEDIARKENMIGEAEKKASANEELYKKMKEKYMSLVKDHADLLRKNADVQKHTETLQQSAQDVEGRRLQLVTENEKLQQSMREKEKDLESEARRRREEAHKLFASAVEATEAMINEAMKAIDDPINAQSTCSAAALMKNVDMALATLNNLEQGAKTFIKDSDQNQVIQALAAFGHHISQTLFNGIATCHLVSDENGKLLDSSCRGCGAESLSYLSNLKDYQNQGNGDVTSTGAVEAKLRDILSKATDLLPKMTDIASGDLQDVVEKEMLSTSQAIESAAARIEEMLREARERDTGVNLEVNERILDSCTELMQAIRALIISSKELQREIVDEGRGASSVKEFYMKNSRWTEGLISAAKAVGFGATLLTDAADQVVQGSGKFEEIIVCSHEIAASTAQLVAASRVKARKMSPKLPKLQKASKDVNAATGRVVASTNSGRKQIDENSDDISNDLSKFTLTQIKRKEMDSQVRTLELEQLLQEERIKLGKLRKQHYILAGVDEEEEKEQENGNNNNSNNHPAEPQKTETPVQKEKPPLPLKPANLQIHN